MYKNRGSTSKNSPPPCCTRMMQRCVYLLQQPPPPPVPADSEAAAAEVALLRAATSRQSGGRRSLPSARKVCSHQSISFLYLSVGFPRLINVCVPSPSLWLLAAAAALTVFHGKLQIWLCQLETLTVP